MAMILITELSFFLSPATPDITMYETLLRPHEVTQAPLLAYIDMVIEKLKQQERNRGDKRQRPRRNVATTITITGKCKDEDEDDDNKSSVGVGDPHRPHPSPACGCSGESCPFETCKGGPRTHRF